MNAGELKELLRNAADDTEIFLSVHPPPKGQDDEIKFRKLGNASVEGAALYEEPYFGPTTMLKPQIVLWPD